MEFLYPSVLWALAFLAVPIIVHLFHFRRFKKVFFSNVRELRELKKQTSARTKLRHRLVLSMRMLAVAALVIAFARPFIKPSEHVSSTGKLVGIYVDNSLSMEAKEDHVTLLEKAVELAKGIVESYDRDTRFQIVYNDAGTRQHFALDAREALAALREIDFSPTFRSLDYVLNVQEELVKRENASGVPVYLLSDFQKQLFQNLTKPDTALRVYALPLRKKPVRNVYIDSVWWEAPVLWRGRTNTLLVRIVNDAETPAEKIRVELDYDGQIIPVGVVDIPARSAVVDTASVPIRKAGWQHAEVRIDDYPVRFDDSWYIAFDVPEYLRVLVLDQGSNIVPYLRAVFQSLGNVDVQIYTPLSVPYDQLGGFHLIILSEIKSLSSGLINTLANYVQQGGTVVFVPHEKGQVDSYNSLLKAFAAGKMTREEPRDREVSDIQLHSTVFRDVFRRAVQSPTRIKVHTAWRFALHPTTRAEQMMRYRDLGPYFVRIPRGQGNLFIIAAPANPEQGDLVKRGEYFVPMLIKSLLSGRRQTDLAMIIGRDKWFPLNTQIREKDPVFALRGEDYEQILEVRNRDGILHLGLTGPVKRAGIYRVVHKDKPLRLVAFNYDRKESQMQPAPEEVMKSYFEVRENIERQGVSEWIRRAEIGYPLWKYFLWLALLALLIEILLLRWLKT